MKIKSIIGVMSCKGGVGKSTLSVNLAVTLSSFLNKKVGLLDADLYGPNHSRLLGVDYKNNFDLNDCFFKPIYKYNVYSMSFGYFLKSDSSVLLRGPMISNTIKYLFDHTTWGDLDILLIDFPPGTGDIYLSLLRDINFSCMILITTPNIMSIDDVKKSVYMLKKFNIKINMLIENMKFFLCDNCSNCNYLYGNNNFAKDMVNEFSIPSFFEIPILKNLNDSVNYGIPFVLSEYCSKNILDLFISISKSV
jgi:ATP-binding protein involved in chromosome partitioning